MPGTRRAKMAQGSMASSALWRCGTAELRLYVDDADWELAKLPGKRHGMNMAVKGSAARTD